MGNGPVLPHPNRPTDPRWKILADFDNWACVPKPEHIRWLSSCAEQWLLRGEFCWLRGFASRRGNSARNQNISDLRAAAVRQFLIDQKHVPDARITGARGSGTSFSTGDRHDNSPNWRGVEVIVTASPVPHRHHHRILIPSASSHGTLPSNKFDSLFASITRS